MVTRLGIPAVILVLAFFPAFAEEHSLHVYVADTRVEVGQVFRITLQAEGRRLGEPHVPSVEELHIDMQPTARETQVMMTSGRPATHTARLVYNATALSAGEITIPPFTMEIDGVSRSSEPVVLQVQPASSERARAPHGRWEREEDLAERIRLDDVAFLRTEVDKTAVYAGEPVVLTFLYHRLASRFVRVSAARGSIAFTFPDAEGFYAIPQRPEESESSFIDQGGRRYQVTRWRQTLFATRPGELVIPAWEWQAVVQSQSTRGMTSQPLELRAEPLTITVKPLPSRPPNFSGAVGQFTFHAQVTPQTTKQSVPVTLAVRVNGTGNPASISEPALPPIENAHVSEPEHTIVPMAGPHGLTAETTFSYRITPLKTGSLLIPALEFCYFDPAAEEYVVDTTQAFTVAVEPSGERDRRHLAGAEIPPAPVRAPSGDGLLPIVTVAEGLRRPSVSGAGVGVLVACPPLAYGLLALWAVRKRRFAEDPTFARSYRARGRLRKRLRKVLDAADPADALYRAVNGYIADKFDLPEAGMTSSDARDVFEARAIEHDAAESLVEILRGCERGRYGGAAFSRDLAASLLERAQRDMDRLDLLLRKESR